MLVSLASLRKIGPWQEAERWYTRTFGSDEITLPTFLRAAAQAELGAVWIPWYAAQSCMPPLARESYAAIEGPARAAYEAVQVPAWKAYTAAEREARSAYYAAECQAWAVYHATEWPTMEDELYAAEKRTCAVFTSAMDQAQKAYDAAQRAAWAAYDSAVRPAWSVYSAAVRQAAYAAADALDGMEVR